MKTWHVIIKQDEKESFDVVCPEGEEKITIPTANYENEVVSTGYVFEELNKNSNIVPSVNAYDLLCIALGIYATDQIISRADGYQGWSRYFKIYIPVNSKSDWEIIKEDFQNLLSFLSGDKWEIVFREIASAYKPDFSKRINQNNIQVVSLFSGGLDSFISAIDILESGRKPAFVSHYKKGGNDAKIQDDLQKQLKEKYGKDSFERFQMYVQPRQKNNPSHGENTSRARSFLFLSLGVAVSNGYGDDVEMIVPENGLISLNVPLTGTRLSSHSTRTTHPYYLSMFISMLRKLGIQNKIHNPYQFYTKGEMMVNCRNQDFLKKTYRESISCSHPSNSRYRKKSPGLHCGYCVPCIIRQASENRSKTTLTEYDWDIKHSPPGQTTQSGSDLRAFKIALERLKGKKDHTILMNIMSTGPLPFDDKQELEKYIGVYKRGMKEVEDFLT